MQLTGERVLRASRDDVFRALHDPAVLRQAIPGCKRFVRMAHDQFEADIAVKVGPLSGTYKAVISVYNDDPPMGYSLHGHADGGQTAGASGGNAHVALAMVDPKTTNLAYHIAATLQGPLADVPTDAVEKVARTLVNEFFSRFELVIVDDVESPAEPMRAAETEEPAALEIDPAVDPAAFHPDGPPMERIAEPPPDPHPADTKTDEPTRDSLPAARPLETRPELPPAVISGYGQASRDAPVAYRAPEHKGKPGIGRWILAAIGIIIIIFLLQDGT